MKKKEARPRRWALSLALIACFACFQSSWAQTPEHPQSLKISPLQQGEILLLSKKPAEALKVYREIWRREPENNYAVRGIVRSHHAMNSLSDGVALLNKYLKEHPQSSAAAYGLGYAYYLQGQFGESRKILEEALKSDPKNSLALNNFAAVLAESRDFENALQKVKSAIEVNPEELMFYRNLQMIYADSGHPDKFENEFRYLLDKGFLIKAKRYGLVLAQQLRQKGFKLYVEGKIDDSIQVLMDMLGLYREIQHPPGIVAGLFSLAVLYEEQGKDQLALEKYREVLKINPQHIQAREKMRSLEMKKD